MKTFPRKQQGVALVISLIILVSLTMLGLTSIQRTTTDLAMAGNQRENGLMFHAAELALLEAEIYTGDNKSETDYAEPTNGLLTVDEDNASYKSPDYFEKLTWDTASTEANTSLVDDFGLAAEPRWMIEYLGKRSNSPLTTGTIGDYGTKPPGKTSKIYRSTARGVGMTGNSYRYVQSYFGRNTAN